MIELLQYSTIHDHPRFTEIPIYKIRGCNWTGLIDDRKVYKFKFFEQNVVARERRSRLQMG
ncbi:unnamed protein product [Brassica oleracea]